MAKINVSVFTKANKLRDFTALLGRICPHPVTDLTFVQQSHNAAVFRGVLDGKPAFFKDYEDDQGREWTQASADEIRAVSLRMAGATGGVGQLLWADVPEAVIAVAEVPGQPVIERLDKPDLDKVQTAIGGWLRVYAGSTAFADRFSTVYWLRKRHKADLSKLADRDAQLVAKLLERQGARAEKLGTVPCLKGRRHEISRRGTSISRGLRFGGLTLKGTKNALWNMRSRGFVFCRLNIQTKRSVLGTRQKRCYIFARF
ncbi:hypothetical protein [Thalassorhabdomicrobium marinisediminis]|uniref:hypothetical protein n=1 Tax=Thalassorhabdomicrobium marinisediminis TaxID=2170577 RepID=UPI002490AC75|nr:hypothetical protein [Thalassorhabdomicrobium marinisediminis]